MAKGDFVGEFELYVMLALAHLGDEAYGVTIRREIERRTGRTIAIGAVYATLSRLEEKGLITRERSDVDGRAVVVTLTDAGREALDAALPDHLETERQLLDGLSTAEREQLADLLRRLLVARGRVPQNP